MGLWPIKGLAAQLNHSGDLEIIAGTGDFEPFVGLSAKRALDHDVIETLEQALDRKEDIHIEFSVGLPA